MSLSLSEARARAAAVAQVSYDVDLDLRDAAPGARFGVCARIGFTALATTGGETFLELTGAVLERLAIDGVAVPTSRYDGRRLPLPGLAPGRHEVEVVAQVPYVTDGDGLHVVTDPADGRTYASAYLGMDVAQRVIPCFDQNDLKAPLTLRVRADPEWTVLANGPLESHDAATGRWAFATTPPLPTAMLVVCAGPWHSRTWIYERPGRAPLPCGWHARVSLAAELDRDFEELARTTEACLDHYATLFSVPMPFPSHHQVFAPGQNWGALETPGCITYRDEYLPRGLLTDRLRASRATTIAHETAHLWFGDLVTMTWWEDTWLQESFADYMGYRVAEDGAGYPDLRVGFETTRKARAYLADARRSTHPVAPVPEDVPDVDSASGNFDMISYAKGHAALRQLVVWLGDDIFLAGVDAYLAAHAFGNATLADFVAALDAASPRPVAEWAERWLRTTGFDTLRIELDADGVPVLHHEGSAGADGAPVRRPHRVLVVGYAGPGLREAARVLVDLPGDGVPVPLPDLRGLVVLPNADSGTYARVVLDPASRAAVLQDLAALPDPLARAVVWGGLLADADDRPDRAALPVEDLLDALARLLPAETPDTVGAVLARVLGRVIPLRVPGAGAAGVLRRLAALCAAALPGAASEEHRLVFLDGVVAGTDDAALLQGWLDAGDAAGIALYPGLRWRLLTRLAALDAPGTEERIAAAVAADPGVDAELGAARARAARPEAAAKAAAWERIDDPATSNRLFEALVTGFWQVEQADLLAPYVERYLACAPTWAARGTAAAQAAGHAFPAIALTPAQLEAVRAAVSDPAVPPLLRRAWEDHLDDRA